MVATTQDTQVHEESSGRQLDSASGRQLDRGGVRAIRDILPEVLAQYDLRDSSRCVLHRVRRRAMDSALAGCRTPQLV